MHDDRSTFFFQRFPLLQLQCISIFVCRAWPYLKIGLHDSPRLLCRHEAFCGPCGRRGGSLTRGAIRRPTTGGATGRTSSGRRRGEAVRPGSERSRGQAGEAARPPEARAFWADKDAVVRLSVSDLASYRTPNSPLGRGGGGQGSNGGNQRSARRDRGLRSAWLRTRSVIAAVVLENRGVEEDGLVGTMSYSFPRHEAGDRLNVVKLVIPSSCRSHLARYPMPERELRLQHHSA